MVLELEGFETSCTLKLAQIRAILMVSHMAL